MDEAKKYIGPAEISIILCDAFFENENYQSISFSSNKTNKEIYDDLLNIFETKYTFQGHKLFQFIPVNDNLASIRLHKSMKLIPGQEYKVLVKKNKEK